MNYIDVLTSAGTLIIETGLWYLALKSLKRTEESIRDTNDQNAISNQRDRWKITLIAYRRLINNTNKYSERLVLSDNYSDISRRELQFFSFVIDWSKEYLLYTDLVDKKLIYQCAGKQLKIIYYTYAKYLKNIPGYVNDIRVLQKALNECDIL